MYFGWDPTQQAIYHRICEQTGTWPAIGNRFYTREEWRRCAGLGLVGLSVPSAYGGGGHGFLDTARAAEAFGRGYQDMGLVFAVMAHLFACAMPIAEHGNDVVRMSTLHKLCSGEWIGANAITEEGAGSDVSALATKAYRTDGDYVLTGTKSFVSNGPVADVFIVYAITDVEFRHLGVSAFVVERDRSGLKVTEPFAKMGLTSCPVSTLQLDECRVPASHLLGEEGQGAAIFQASMRWERTCLFAAYLGQTERLLDRCVEHARKRRQFGRAICANQAISHRIARMRLRLEAARLLLWQACWRLDRGERAVLDVAMAKLAVSEGVVDAALQSLQIFGGAGIRTDMGVEQELRDALPCTIFSGSSEMQLEQIAKELGL
ncbi:MAG: acyl-CoA dehydrogenase family protein [Pseudonocardiaceae bacterium]